MVPANNEKRRSMMHSLILGTAILVTVFAVAVQLLLHNWTAVMFFDKLLDFWQGCDADTNPYLHGNFAPVATEHRGVPLQVIQGALPPDLIGLFARNGPNPMIYPKKCHHWFDGHGMLHTVRIKQHENKTTTAAYSNTYIPTPRYLLEQKHGNEIFLKLGELTGIPGFIKTLVLRRAKLALTHTTFLTSGQANTHILVHDNKVYALHEASLPLEIVLREDGHVEQEAVGFETFGNVLNYPVSAHVKVDFHVAATTTTTNQQQSLLFHGYSPDPTLIQRDGPLKVGETINHQIMWYKGIQTFDGQASFSHDNMFTQNWMVLLDTSVVFDPKQILLGESVFSWSAKRHMRIGLVPRNTSRNHHHHDTFHGEALWVDLGAPHMAVHPLNAWEEEVVDDSSSSSTVVVIWLPLADRFTMNLEQGKNTFYMTELRIDPTTGTMLTKTRIDDTYNVEFSRVRDDCVGQFARFGYTGFVDEQEAHVEGTFIGFNVWDMERKVLSRSVRYPRHELGGEPVVVPKPGKTGSDEVYIGLFLHNVVENTSSFVLFNGGEEDSEDPVATLSIPFRVPFGFHGRWLEEEELQKHIQYHARQNVSKASA